MPRSDFVREQMALFGWTRDKRKAADEWVEKGSQAATPEEACRCYDKAIEIEPNNVAAWYNKGLVLDGLNRYDEAIQCYDKFIKNRSELRKRLVTKGLALVLSTDT
jgi:tetratricopeptide (TPR) repeat protein